MRSLAAGKQRLYLVQSVNLDVLSSDVSQVSFSVVLQIVGDAEPEEEDDVLEEET